MADRSEIKTQFTLEGIAKAMNEVRNFVNKFQKSVQGVNIATQRAEGGVRGFGLQIRKVGFESHQVFRVMGVEVRTVGALGAGLVKIYQGVAWSIRKAFETVIGTLRMMRTVATSTFAYIQAGAAAAGSVVNKLFGGAQVQAQGLLKKTAIQALTGGGASALALKFTLSSGVVPRILGALGSIASGFKSMMEKVWSTVFSPRRLMGLIRFGRRLTMLLASPTAAAIAGVNSGSKAIQETVNDVASTTGAGGFGPSETQKYKGFFQQLGHAPEDAAEALGKFAEASRDIAQNGANSEFAQSLAAAGVAFQNLNGQARTGQQIFYDLWQVYANGEDPLNPGRWQQANLALQRIVGNGKALTGMLDLWNGALVGGDDFIAHLNRNAEIFGTTIGPEQILAMKNYEAGLGMLKQAFLGFKMTLATQLGPFLGTWFTGIANFIAQNRDRLVGWISSFVSRTALLITELAIVITQSRQQFAGYGFKFPWLVTLRDFAVKAWGALKILAGGLLAVGTAAAEGLQWAYGQVQPHLASLWQSIRSGTAWLLQAAVALYAFQKTGQKTAGFEWIEKLFQYLGYAKTLLLDLWNGVDGFMKKMKASPDSGSFYESLKNGLAKARDYVIDLGRNIHRWLNGKELEDGFGWVDKVGSGLATLWGWFKKGADAVLNFVNVIAGKQDALDASPKLAKLRQQLIGDVWPRLKALASNVWDFIVAAVPPLFRTIEGIFATLKPYLDGLGTTLKNAGDNVIHIVENVARWFSGKKLEDNFAWVGSLLENVKALAVAFKDLAGWVADAAKALTLHWSGDEKAKNSQEGKALLDRFAWLTKLSDTIGAIKDFFVWISKGVTELTGGLIGPGAQGLIAFLGLVLIPKILGVGAAFVKAMGQGKSFMSWLGGKFGLTAAAPAAAAAAGGAGGVTGLGVGGAALAAGMAGGVTGPIPFKTANDARRMTPEEIGAAHRGLSQAGIVAAKTAVEESGFMAALRTGAGVISRLFGVVGWVLLGVELMNLLAQVTGLKEKIKNFFGVTGAATRDGFDGMKDALGELKKKTAEADEKNRIPSPAERMAADRKANDELNKERANANIYSREFTERLTKALNGIQMTDIMSGADKKMSWEEGFRWANMGMSSEDREKLDANGLTEEQATILRLIGRQDEYGGHPVRDRIPVQKVIDYYNQPNADYTNTIVRGRNNYDPVAAQAQLLADQIRANQDATSARTMTREQAEAAGLTSGTAQHPMAKVLEKVSDMLNFVGQAPRKVTLVDGNGTEANVITNDEVARAYEQSKRRQKSTSFALQPELP